MNDEVMTYMGGPWDIPGMRHVSRAYEIYHTLAGKRHQCCGHVWLELGIYETPAEWSRKRGKPVPMRSTCGKCGKVWRARVRLVQYYNSLTDPEPDFTNEREYYV